MNKMISRRLKKIEALINPQKRRGSMADFVACALGQDNYEKYDFRVLEKQLQPFIERMEDESGQK